MLFYLDNILWPVQYWLTAVHGNDQAQPGKAFVVLQGSLHNANEFNPFVMYVRRDLVRSLEVLAFLLVRQVLLRVAARPLLLVLHPQIFVLDIVFSTILKQQ